MPERRIAGHSFDSDLIDARCTMTHTNGDGSRCPMTRSWLWEATEADEGKQGYPAYGALNRQELCEIREDEKRIRGAAWDALVGVCS